ncbi:MAG: outer membrane lipoprotein carrier protein LolA [Bacteroidetes bacterium]|nr:outer membrane lipoprotein carrier protein LolA [Bacteroidota bacterium]
MKKLFLFIAFLIPLVAISQMVVLAQKDSKATALLDQVSKKTKSFKTLKVEFSYNMENKQAKIKESKKGTLLLQGDKYKLDIAGQIVICDGKTVWTYIKDANEVHINEVGTDEDAFTPSRLLSSYNQNYKSKMVKAKNEGEASVELIPLKGKNYTKVILTVDKEQLQVKRFIIYDKVGNVFSYVITKFSPNPSLNVNEFTFNKADYPDAEIIDMR